MITLKDLANELKVSVSTVSKALSDSHEISKETKEKILNLAKERNYTPNNTAVNLRRKQTKTIGVVIPNIFNHFYTKILSGIESEARKKGYKTIISISNETFSSEEESLLYFSNGSVDGILLAPSEESEKLNKADHILELKNKEIPFVLFDRYFENFTTDKVTIDDFDAAKNAIIHFKESGRKNILVISMLKNLWIGKLRKEGALSIHKVQLIETESEVEMAKEIEKKLKTQKIDAILALDELSGIISLNAVRELKLKIPEEVSIISFSQGILSKYSYPKLSTINQNAQNIGIEALKLLINKIENKNLESVTKIIKSSLEINNT
ncbi:LacI family transcriptional regulator [Tenacibaculum adriaticum]|uniref:LacI family transcriptional regulator n=1 Tax=Tenacibaculum adriaticum TaxID=413713 RepID=A0A5S5DTN1_9FLAO|nr:LacI family DNA-binding transcriptional regulator [Tenacibaculum adriaticum]TYP99300.1 LacI family transcriptional regulator [Tenacibaculum adriaticum]